MNLEFWTALQAIGSVLTVMVGIAGFWFLHRQIRQVRAAVSREALEALYARNHDILRVIIECPNLRPYFYEDAPIEKTDPNHGTLMTVCEMVIDFYEGVYLQKDHMEPELFASWQRYWQDLCKNSAAMRCFINEHQDWYSKPLLHAIFPTLIPSGNRTNSK